jgi:hypothetical protein
MVECPKARFDPLGSNLRDTSMKERHSLGYEWRTKTKNRSNATTIPTPL